jgi:hypothetical protein
MPFGTASPRTKARQVLEGGREARRLGAKARRSATGKTKYTAWCRSARGPKHVLTLQAQFLPLRFGNLKIQLPE